MKNPLLLIAIAVSSAPALALGDDARNPSPLERVTECVAGDDQARDAVAERLGDYDALLEMLPIDSLSHVKNNKEWVELTFDFGRKSSRKVKVPGGSQWVLGKGDKPRQCRYDGQTLIIHKSVRLHFAGSILRSVRKGDVELKYGIFSPNVQLRCSHDEGRIARNGDGLPLLALDENGKPYRKNGEWVLRRADDWLVVKVKSHEVWVPAERKAPDAATARARSAKPARKSA